MKVANENKEIATTVLEMDTIISTPYKHIEYVLTHKSNEYSEGSRTYLFFKRFFDVLLSIIGLICLSPLFIIVSVLIKMDDPNGGIFFKQKRVGKNGDTFYMYKFRSMVSNAETLLNDIVHLNEVEGAMFKIKDDPRITKIGSFLRKTSLDELPQLWNVIKGEMSLVGPRPPLLKEVELYTERDLLRLLVVPGCTGLWQATVRNTVGFKEMVEIDLDYIVSKSIFMDFKIILMTFKVLLDSKAH